MSDSERRVDPDRASCERASLVEASFDGRLWPNEQASLERHLRTCASCRELHDDLVATREALQSSAKPITSLHHQRVRLAILRAAAEPAKKRRPTWLLAAAIVMVPVAVWAGISEVSRRREPATLGANAMEIESTSLAIAPPPVIAHAPVASVESEPSPEPAPTPSIVVAPPTVSPASQTFNAAMEAIERGDFGAGAGQLERFVERYPQDPRVEEAMYLDAIALERAGRATEAKSAARRYLEAYPNGAHRSRAWKLVDENIPKVTAPVGQ